MLSTNLLRFSVDTGERVMAKRGLKECDISQLQSVTGIYMIGNYFAPRWARNMVGKFIVYTSNQPKKAGT